MRVVQCWDDGVVDDVRLTELLRRYAAKASFNLNPGLHQSERYQDWLYRDTKPVYKLALAELPSVYQGFTIANHTLSHPDLTKLPADEVEREIREGRDQLEQLFGRAVHGFAYPFGAHSPSLQAAVRKAGHAYARTVGQASPVFPPLDPMLFHPTCHHQDPTFWQKWDRVKSQDGAGTAVFYFWGHSYELVTEDDWAVFENKLIRISQEATAQWWDLPALFGLS